MAAGKIVLQANDGKTLSLVAPEGMSANTTSAVVPSANPVFTGNVVVPTNTSDPASPVTGSTYFNTTDNALKIYGSNSEWGSVAFDNALANVGGLLKTHYWQDSTHRSFGTGGIYVLSNTFSQEGSNSKFVIDCGIVVGASDNVSGHIQLYYNGSWHTTSYRGTSAYQDYNNSSWGDLAHRHEGGMPLKQHAKFVWQPNVTGTLGVRMYIQAENGTRYINRGNSWGSHPNSISGFSSITVQEVSV